MKKYDSASLADALMSYIGNFGLFDELISDPGSDLTSKAVEELNKWLGIRHVVSLVDVHTSNGCENTNRQVITHLSALCNELRVKDKWDDPKILALIQLHFNGQVSSEAGITPFQALFGTADDTYYDLPVTVQSGDYQTEYVSRLDDALNQLRKISAKFQDKLFNKRVFAKPTPHQYVVGDMVLRSVRTPTKHWKPEKLGPAFYGPYEVEFVHKNDYTCRHVTEGTVHKLHVSMLKPYFGTRTMARRAALLDYDQYVVTRVEHYTGDPSARTSMEFFIHFSDGDKHWQTYNTELLHCEAFDEYCKSVPELWPLLHTDQVYRKERVKLNKTPITSIQPGDVRYVDQRSIDPHWYNGLLPSANPNLPNEDTTTYVVPFHFSGWTNKAHTKVSFGCEELGIEGFWNHDKVRSWGSYDTIREGHVLVDKAFLQTHPSVLRSLRKWKAATQPVARAVLTTVKKPPVRRKVKLKSKKAPPTAQDKSEPRPSTRSSTRLANKL